MARPLSSVWILVFVGLAWLGPLQEADTPSYRQHDIIRSPLYPAWLTAGMGADGVLVVLQLALGFGAAAALTRGLRRQLAVGAGGAQVIFAILLAPYYGSSLFGNRMLSEALAYPIFLVAMRALLLGLGESSTRRLLSFFAWSALAILTRRQFLFLVPVGAALLLYAFVYARTAFRPRVLVAGFLAMFGVAELGDRAYHLMLHDRFIPPPLVGIQLAVGALMVADDPKDVALRRAREDMESEGLTLSGPSGEAHMRYTLHYTRIYTLVFVHSREAGRTTWPEIDRATTEAALGLIREHPLAWGRLVAQNMIQGTGGYLIFGTFLLTVGAALMAHHRTRHRLALLYLAVSVTALCNLSLLAVVQIPLKRYTAYTDTVLAAVVVTILLRAMKLSRAQPLPVAPEKDGQADRG